MFGLSYSVKCPHCGKQYITDLGITPVYAVKGKEEIGSYCKETCVSCNKPFLSLCEAKTRGIKESDMILKIEDFKEGDIVSAGCICF